MRAELASARPLWSIWPRTRKHKHGAPPVAVAAAIGGPPLVGEMGRARGVSCSGSG